MNKILSLLGVIAKSVRKNKFVYFAIAIYTLSTVFYMGPSVWDCGNTLAGMGDNTAGPIWKAENAGDTPFGGFVKTTNYPWGESLASPIDAVVAGQSVVLWTTAKIAGPVCGYNVSNMIGFMSATLVMFFFVRRLLKGKSNWIALLAGYIVAFSPYFQIKTVAHPGYAFQALLIGILWAFMSLVTTRKKSRAFILAGLIALCFYFDPYFSLLSATIIAPLVLVWAGISVFRYKKRPELRKDIVRQLKLLLVTGAMVVAAIIPLVLVMTTQSSEIKASVAGTRDMMVETAKQCSNWPQEYLLPFPHSPLFSIFGSEAKRVQGSLYEFSTCGLAEDAVGISLVVVLIVLLFFLIAGWEKIKKNKLELGKIVRYDPKLLIIGTAVVGLVAVVLALPPVHIFGIPLPSYLMVETSSIWRIIAREYVILNIAITVLFAIALAYFVKNINITKTWKIILYVGIVLLVAAQYQTANPLTTYDTGKFKYSEASDTYYWLKEQNDIDAIAEYPIEKAVESGAHGYYLTMQLIHDKPLLNSARSDSAQEPVRSSIKDLSDPQTLPVLHALGINTLVVHGVDPDELEKIPYLSVIYSGDDVPDKYIPDSPAITNKYIAVVRIDGDVPTINASLRFLDNVPRNSSIQTSANNWGYEVPSGTQMAYQTLKDDTKMSTEGTVCFEAKMSAGDDKGTLVLNSNGRTISSNQLSDEYKQVSVKVAVGEKIELTTNSGHNVQLTNLGCKPL